MPSWVWILLAVVAVALGAWWFASKGSKVLPSGNVSTAESVLNAPGNQ